MTPAVLAAEAAGIAHRVIQYEHDASSASYGLEAAEALGLDELSVFKTLIASVDSGEMVVAMVGVGAMLDLKALARAAGAKRAAMADVAAAERSSGFVAGGISPLGQRTALRTFIDEWITVLDEVHVSGGRRGLEIALAPSDLVALTNAVVAPIATTD